MRERESEGQREGEGEEEKGVNTHSIKAAVLEVNERDLLCSSCMSVWREWR